MNPKDVNKLPSKYEAVVTAEEVVVVDVLYLSIVACPQISTKERFLSF